MATYNLPRFVKVDYAAYSAGTPDASTLYFITDLGVIYQGTELVTRGVQTDNTKKVPGLFYVLGEGKDAKLVTYASATAEPTVVGISENEIDAKVKVASDAAAAVAKDLADNYSTTTAVEGLISAAKEEIGGDIDNLTAADVAYTASEGGVVTGATVQAAIESIDTKLAAITGGEGGDSLASQGLRITGLEELTEGYTGKGSIKTAVDAAQGDATQALADAKKANDAIATYGDIVTHNAAEFESAGAAAGAQAAIEAKLGGNFGTEEGQQTVDAAIKAVDAKFASYSTSDQVDSKISTALSSVLKFKGVVANIDALNAITGMVEGDVYYVTAESKEFVYVDEDGKKGWEELGASVDYAGMLAPYLLIGETFTAGEILIAGVNGEDKSAGTTGITVGGAALAESASDKVLATEAAVKAAADAVDAKVGGDFSAENTVAAHITDIEAALASMEWKTTM